MATRGDEDVRRRIELLAREVLDAVDKSGPWQWSDCTPAESWRSPPDACGYAPDEPSEVIDLGRDGRGRVFCWVDDDCLRVCTAQEAE